MTFDASMNPHKEEGHAVNLLFHVSAFGNRVEWECLTCGQSGVEPLERRP